MGLHIVEGIYGRDGDFNQGPIPWVTRTTTRESLGLYDERRHLRQKPLPRRYRGHWLGGHEPGNFGLFHIAMERGKLDVMNPMNIPVYECRMVSPSAATDSFTRTPLRSFYLHQRHTEEPLWHLVDQPFD